MMRQRGAIRVIPGAAVTVAMETELFPLAYGVVANISEAGACVLTNGAFPVGESLVLQLSFPQEPETLQAAGRIVWRRYDPKGTCYGLQWAATSGPQHARLTGLINRERPDGGATLAPRT